MLNIYSDKVSNRLIYVLDLIFKDLLGLEYNLCSDEIEVESEGLNIYYSDTKKSTGVHIKPYNLLFEKDIRDHEIQMFDWGELPAFFRTMDAAEEVPFDLFSAVFYLVTRYEEYLPHVADKHGRFQPDQSIAFKESFLKRPLINEWVIKLKKVLRNHNPSIEFKELEFRFISTIDIDSAWQYKHKGPFRTTFGLLKYAFTFNWGLFSERLKVLGGKSGDRFDTYNYIKEIHNEYVLQPLFFILFSTYGDYDRNINIFNKYFHALLKELGDYAKIGIHPSYQSNSVKELIKKEKDGLEKVIHREVFQSRQHFIRMKLPNTYRALINAGVSEDYSMGYASQSGFRASICSPFYFFDIELNHQTNLQLFPFAVMDGTLNDYLNLNIAEAEAEVENLIDAVKSVDGCFIQIWHNESLSDEDRWKGWRKIFENSLKQAKQ